MPYRNDTKIKCRKCGWLWQRSKGGLDPYKCHKCDYNNKDMYNKKIIGLGNVPKYSKKDIDLIYKHTSKGYKSIVNGVKYVLYGDDEIGTVLAPVKNLPKMTFKAKLRQAKFREKK